MTGRLKITLCCLAFFLLWTLGAAADPPTINLPETHYDFGEVEEGSVVSHGFIIKNTGSLPLEIKEVRPGWGCAVAHFDRVIPAGGEGKVTVKVDLRGYQGKVWKSATIISNDPQRSSMTINLQGKVKPWIDIRPSRVIYFRKAGGTEEEKSVELISSDLPFSILRTETTLNEKIRFHLETVEEKKHYRLKISPLVKQGSYSGSLKCLTDHPKKPEVLLQVIGQFDK